MNKYQAYRARVAQNPEKLEEQRRKTRERVALHRKKKKECNATCNATLEENVTLPEEYEVALHEGKFPADWTEEDIREFISERLAIHEFGGG